jgi:hypothetical protein
MKDFISKLNWVVILGIVVAVETQISNGTMSIAHSFPEAWQPIIKEWAGNLAGVGALIMAGGAYGQRPAGQFTITPTSTMVKVLIVAFLLSMFLAGGSAQAQHLRPPAVTGNPVEDIKSDLGISARPGANGVLPPQGSNSLMSVIARPLQDLANFINSDQSGAAELATQIPDLQDTNGRACWLKMQSAAAVFKAHPVPLTLQAMTDFEALRLLQMTANNLCSYAPCSIVSTDAQNLATAVAAKAGGVLTGSISIPSLTQICSQIPQISPMLPEAALGPLPLPSPSPSPTPTPSPSATP